MARVIIIGPDVEIQRRLLQRRPVVTIIQEPLRLHFQESEIGVQAPRVIVQIHAPPPERHEIRVQRVSHQDPRPIQDPLDLRDLPLRELLPRRRRLVVQKLVIEIINRHLLHQSRRPFDIDTHHLIGRHME